MNAVLFYVNPTFRLTGSTINAIEYYLAGLEHNKDIKLLLIDGKKFFTTEIHKLIRDRYDIEWEKAIKNIEVISRHKVPGIKFDTILIVDYLTIYKIKGIIRAKKILVISEKYTEDPEYFLSKELYNVEYHGEMPFHYKDYNYRMKCLFNSYKPLKKVESGTYINSPRNNDFGFIYTIEIPHLPFIIKSKTKPKENLFEKFTHYIYYHANKWFDPHPRLFLECEFYGKHITYINRHNIKDGSWYRYNDLLERGLRGRTLNKDDAIIRQLI